MEIGDTLYRHQQNGDSVLMNRQPTLLPMSIGNHKIQVARTNQTDTLDLNVIGSKLYNF
jgi:DNA-directed RNA polymerase beta' subunit